MTGAWTKAFAALLAAAIVMPVLAVAPLAFSEQSFLVLPPRTWSLRWWSVFFADASWLRALLHEPGGRGALLPPVGGGWNLGGAWPPSARTPREGARHRPLPAGRWSRR